MEMEIKEVMLEVEEAIIEEEAEEAVEMEVV